MFEQMTISNFLIIFIILILSSFIYLQYLKFHRISTVRHQCQLIREKLNKIYLTTDVLDQEYLKLKQILSSSSVNDNHIEQQRSLIDQQRIHTLEHLNRQLKNEMNTIKLVNESLRKRLNSTSQINTKNEYIIPNIRHNPSRKPWFQFRLPSIPEDEIPSLFYYK